MFFVITSSISIVSAQAPNYTTSTANQCISPAETLFITGGPGEVYNVSTLSAPTSTCVKITLHNADTIIHTFTINAISANNISYFNIYSKSQQTYSSNFWTPSQAMTIKFFCSVPGHEEAGMVGTLKIVSNANANSISSPTTNQNSINTNPSFDVIPVIFMFLVIDFIYTLRKNGSSK